MQFKFVVFRGELYYCPWLFTDNPVSSHLLANCHQPLDLFPIFIPQSSNIGNFTPCGYATGQYDLKMQ